MYHIFHKPFAARAVVVTWLLVAAADVCAQTASPPPASPPKSVASNILTEHSGYVKADKVRRLKNPVKVDDDLDK